MQRHETGMCDVCFRQASPTVESVMNDEYTDGHVLRSSRETCRACLIRMLTICDAPGLELFNRIIQPAV
ncbi:MAG: hypothetical protein LC802_05150 [Acidobacteria bacterium]|nr:hypothetical protein [Acidobacteriota bacterium]